MPVAFEPKAKREAELLKEKLPCEAAAAGPDTLSC
jgi:hypothetical protein